MDLTPTDFVSGLGGLANLPNPFRETQEATQAAQQNQAGQQQLALGALKLGALQQQAQQEQQYQADVATALKTGDFAGLYAKYPDQQKALQAAHDALDEPTKRAQERDLFAVSSYIKNGAIDSAKKLLQQRIDADRTAGQDTADDQQMLDALNSGDPNAVKSAADMALYAILPEDKRAEMFGKDRARGFAQLGSGGIFNLDTGEVVRQPEDKPHYEKVTNADGTESIVQIGGSGGGGPASSGGAPSGSDGAPLSTRLHNPGAIRFDPKNQWQGQVGQEGGFVQFDTLANGQRAHRKLIANQIKAGFDTPLAWAQHYAPASDGNDPVAYAQQVAKGLGIGINDKIPLGAVPKVAAISAQVEAGGTPAPADYTQISPTQAARVVYTSQGSGDGAGGLTPEALDFAANWAIAHGGKAPSGFARNKAAQTAIQNAIAQKAKEAGLTVDQVVAKGQDFVTQQQALNAFAKGKQGDAVRSASVALDHLAQLHDALLALKNGNVQFFNRLSQLWERQTGNPLPTNAAAMRGIVADEVNKAVLAGNGALADREDVHHNLDIAGSNDQMMGVIKSYTGLMGGQLAGLERQYRAGTGRDDFGRFLSPTARKLLTRAKANEGENAVPADVAAILKKYGH